MPQKIAQYERFGACLPAGCVVEVHDRRHVDDPHARVDSVVVAEVDELEESPCAVEYREGEFPRLSRQREYRAVVIGVGVHVEQARVEGLGDLRDGAWIPARRDVRDREERHR